MDKMQEEMKRGYKQAARRKMLMEKKVDEIMKCQDCCYLWKEEWEEYPCCHWVSRCPDDKAPCEYEDEPPHDWQDEC